MDAQTIDRHSVNCYVCTELKDERNCSPADKYNSNNGGSICESCQSYIDDAILNALEAALWTINDDEEEKAKNCTVHEFPEDSEGMSVLRTELTKLYLDHKKLIEEDEISSEMFGHDFWLTAQGHGAGFWDRGYKNGDKLTEACKSLCSEHLYVFINDDGTPDLG